MGSSISWSAGRLVDYVLGAPGDLPTLADITELSPQVIRVLGQNPGQATLQGTNTYLVGDGPKRMIIDTSDGNQYWWPLMQKALNDHGAVVSEVLLTHRHYDHVGGISEIRNVFPEARVWKARGSLPSPGGAGRRCQHKCCDGDVPDNCGVLDEGKVVSVGGVAVRVLFTPGHTDDSVCFILNGSEGIFTGDTILGGRSAMFDDVERYNMSLRKLSNILTVQCEGGAILYPGHGDSIPAEKSCHYVDRMIRMQRMRETAILDTLQTMPDSSVSDLCSAMYPSSVQSAMAQSLIQLHLEAMEARGQVRKSESWLGSMLWQVQA